MQIVEQLNVNQDIKVKTQTTEGYDQLIIDSKAKDEKMALMESANRKNGSNGREK